MRCFALAEQNRHAAGRGFTLVEMSIVLVIVGLIIGGVLTGRDLIEASQIRAQMRQVEQLNTSIMTFKGKYNCLPGDCSNATSFFNASSQPNQVSNGDGDGKITGGDPGNLYAIAWYWAGNQEWKSVFDHLAASGLWNIGQYDETDAGGLANMRAGYAFPACAMKGSGTYLNATGAVQGLMDCGVIVLWQIDAHYIRIGAAPEQNSPYFAFYTGYTPPVAQRIDSKFDDGMPYSGAIQVGAIHDYQIWVDGTEMALNENTPTFSTYCTNPVNDTVSRGDNGNIKYTTNSTYTPNRSCSLRVKTAGF